MGKRRAFRLLVTFVSVAVRINCVVAADKTQFGHRGLELGFIQDVKRFTVIIPEDRQKRIGGISGTHFRI